MPEKEAYVSTRLILRDNLKACMQLKDFPQTQVALQAKSGVGQNTISRIISDEGENTTLEKLAKLAKAYELEPWQLLVPGMDPKNPPVLQPATAAQQALWKQIQDAFAGLPEAPSEKK